MSARRFLRRLGSDVAGVTMVEFAMLSPLLIVMLFGVLQVGIMVQNYSAVRQVSANVARYAMVQFATANNTLTDADLTAYATSVAQHGPYLLNSTMAVSVTDVDAPAVDNVTEKTLTITYQIPTLLDKMGLKGPVITYSQPLFLTTNASA